MPWGRPTSAACPPAGTVHPVMGVQVGGTRTVVLAVLAVCVHAGDARAGRGAGDQDQERRSPTRARLPAGRRVSAARHRDCRRRGGAMGAVAGRRVWGRCPWASEPDEQPYGADLSYKIVRNDDAVTSLLFTYSMYLGGAHPTRVQRRSTISGPTVCASICPMCSAMMASVGQAAGHRRPDDQARSPRRHAGAEPGATGSGAGGRQLRDVRTAARSNRRALRSVHGRRVRPRDRRRCRFRMLVWKGSGGRLRGPHCPPSTVLRRVHRSSTRSAPTRGSRSWIVGRGGLRAAAR